MPGNPTHRAPPGMINKTMREKRMQHVADILCQMFCGWRLILSKPMLLDLGSGTVEIDALTGQCMFQNNPTPQLPIAKDLLAWTKEELVSHHIAIAGVIRARIAAKLTFAQVRWKIRTAETCFADDGDARSMKLHQCTFDCESEIAMDAIVYHSRLREVQEWFLGWPQH
jgi:hypothetical protein